MSARTVYLSRLIGLFALIVGLAMFFRRIDLAATMALIVRDQPLMFLIGVGALSAGLAIVLAHSIWSGLAAIVVTVIGWLSILRGLFLLFLPGGAEATILASMNFASLAFFYAALFIVVGLYLTYAGFSVRSPSTS